MAAMTEHYYIGVDVGTASVRAALVSSNGSIVSSASRPLQIWQPRPDFYEQSSEDIWKNVCAVVKEVVGDKQPYEGIRGIGFDATCSLVALDPSGAPVTVSPSKEPHRNIIMWLDHRAVKQAQIINDTKHKVLSYVGGTISPEMEMPKLLWLKQHMSPECWHKSAIFLELPEFLSYKATGHPTRSMCSVVCKFNYMGHKSQLPEGSCNGWDSSFLHAIGLEDLVEANYSKLGDKVRSPGEPVGEGLTKSAANDLGLWKGMPVGTSIIDAHAGGLGVIGADLSSLLSENKPLTSRMALICGTSSCHMAISQEPIFVPGVWGPYFSAMVPGLWLNEGGQSVTGKLLDHIIETHVAYRDLKDKAEKSGCSIYEELNNHVTALAERKRLENVALLSQDVHVLPDFHGNRSPVADPYMTGMICGLSLAADIDVLALLYLATLQALAHGSRHIIESMNKAGHSVDTLFLCGGLTKNKLFIQTHADITGLPCILSHESECVLVGAAILGACASGEFPSIQDAMKNMNAVGHLVKPQESLKWYYDKKHQVFLKMLKNQLEYRDIMKS
ncbi:FGGY carbohydrate kinase domain-containing protein-like isoform X1 [Montipora capricornis]|uniref:FGGY carbohydrate kinase domain-containing protein-like isoform X1 n=1 Tax=Montipora capricornis TaxID=246305 RepID=UPI0035F1972B